MSQDTLIDEAGVPQYKLPDLFDGKPNPQYWADRRRELLETFAEHVYGRTPLEAPEGGWGPTVRSREAAPFAEATRIQFRIQVGPPGNRHAVALLLYLPEKRKGPVPVFLGLNFSGNHTIHTDPGISLPESWMFPWDGTGVVDHRATEAGRGTRAHRWPVERILERGYGLATLYCGDLAPDQQGHPRISSFRELFAPAPDPQSEWGNLGIWAWSLSRAREAISALAEVDAHRIIAIGHSRMGKAALWAAAQDPLFAAAISNNSGCLGAALSRRKFGETVAKISKGFPHWFCPRLSTYAEREEQMPVDQHMLLALIAPRPLYVSSASEDLWADPRGEFLAAVEASAAYRLFGHEGIAGTEFPEVEAPLHGDRIGYHIRRGTHNMLRYDWERFMDFMDKQWE
ncbi:MAG: acetylxylan esterase [Verrucomicrobia bacterium]|nr:acetylxylan esterase [Verrucomicrobiota bacterium]MCH8511775.1 acetylxylan esterase [Kiritimatiellia bacterium]